MGIRLKHDAAALGTGGGRGGGDGSSQRKYGQALVMQQQEANRRMQERQQDAMLAYGRERRGVVDDWNRRAEEDVRARQRFQMATDARREENQRMLDARRDDQAIDHKNRMEVIGQGQDFQRRMMEDEIARSDKERRDQARLASAMAKGEIEQAIADGEFDEATARKLQQTFIDELAIIDDTYPDETQRDEALAQLRARRLRMAQNRKSLQANTPNQPQSALDAFNQNQEIEDRFMDLAREELAAGSDDGKPPVYDDIFKRAQEIYDTRYKAAGGAGGGQQQPSGAPAARQQGGAEQTAASGQASAQQAAAPRKWEEMEMPDVPPIDWKRAIENSPAKEESFSNMAFHYGNMEPDIQKAVNYAIGEANAPGVAEARNYLASQGIDMNLMMQMPQANQDWSPLGAPSESRQKMVNIKKFSKSQPKDVQNAIAIWMDPKQNDDAKKIAMRHLMNRGVDLLSVANGQ